MTLKESRRIALALAKIGAKSQNHAEIIAEAMAKIGMTIQQENSRFNKDDFYRFYMAKLHEFRSLARRGIFPDEYLAK